MDGVLIVAIVFAVPISAILSNVWLKAKKLDAQGGGDKRLADKVDALAAENIDLRKRIETLETIVTTDSPAPRSRVRVDATAPGLRDEAPAVPSSTTAARLG